MATLVKTNDARIDRIERLADIHDEQLREVSRTGDRRRENNRTIYLMLATILLTELGQLVAHIAHIS